MLKVYSVNLILSLQTIALSYNSLHFLQNCDNIAIRNDFKISKITRSLHILKGN